MSIYNPSNLFYYIIDRCAMMALRCLSILYTPAYKRKRLGDDIPYILKIVPVSNHVSYLYTFHQACIKPSITLLLDTGGEQCVVSCLWL